MSTHTVTTTLPPRYHHVACMLGTLLSRNNQCHQCHQCANPYAMYMGPRRAGHAACVGQWGAGNYGIFIDIISQIKPK